MIFSIKMIMNKIQEGLLQMLYRHVFHKFRIPKKGTKMIKILSKK